MIFFFFNDTATTEIYTLSLHDALPILRAVLTGHVQTDCISCYQKIFLLLLANIIHVVGRRNILTLVINRKLSNFKQKQGNT